MAPGWAAPHRRSDVSRAARRGTAAGGRRRGPSARFSEAPEPAPPPVQQIIRQIKTVLIEVPPCENSPGLDGTPSFSKAHVNLQLIKSRSSTGRNLVHRLWWGLKATGTELANGRKVFNRNDAVVWLTEQLQEGA